jgi:predicted dehydrogenase
MKKRGVLIGCGFFANNHLNAWKLLEEIELVAVCDRDTGKAERAAAHFGIPRSYTDAAQMLDVEKPDFVDIVTTVPSHLPLIELACQAGAKLVICQKPFVETQAEGEAAVMAAEAFGAKLIIHENFRWQYGYIELKRLLEEDSIGTPHFARIQFRTHYNVYQNQPYLAEIERFLLFDVGLHLYDLVRHLMGEVEYLACQTQSLHPLVRGEDSFSSLLRHTSGAVSVVDASCYSWNCPDLFPQVLARIEGERGTLEIVEGYRLRLHTPQGMQEFNVEPSVPEWGEKPWHCVQDSVMRFQSHAVDVLYGRAEPQPSGADNLKTLSLTLASYDSAGNDRGLRIT